MFTPTDFIFVHIPDSNTNNYLIRIMPTQKCVHPNKLTHTHTT